MDIGPYRLLDEIGRGASGVVHRAEQRALRRLVALKLLETAADEDAAARFRREIKLAASCVHPNLVRVFDGGVVDGRSFLAMELLEGEPLSARTALRRPIPWAEALGIAAGIAAGLACLHERGVMHRDVKPSNVMLLNDGGLKLVDFGLARRAGSTWQTAAGDLIATLAYAAPEVLLGQEHGPAADLWALGCVLYELIAGQPHGEPQDLRSWMGQLVTEPPPPGQRQPGVPADVDQVVLELLAFDAAARPQSTSALADRLIRLAERSGSGGYRALPALSSRAVRRLAGRRHARLGMAAGVAVAALTLVAQVLRGPDAGGMTRASSPASIASSRATSPVPLTMRWRQVEPLLPAITTGHKLAAPLLARLRATGGLDLGTDARAWSYWVRLGRWLEEPDRAPTPPRSAMAAVGAEMPPLDRAVFHYFGADEPTPDRLASALRAVELLPDDARTWLALGRLFEREGRADAARTVYQHALTFELSRLSICGPMLWRALVAALVMQGRLAREWLPRMVKLNDAMAWVALRSELPERGLPHAHVFLALALADPRLRGAAANQGGALLIETGEPEKGVALWREIAAQRQSETPAGNIAHYELQRGRISAALDVAATYQLEAFELMPAYLTVETPSATCPTTPDWATSPSYLGLELGRLLERAQYDAAEELLTHVQPSWQKEHAPRVWVEIAANVGASPTALDGLRALIAAGPPAPLLDAFAGAWTTPPGEPWMERALAAIAHDDPAGAALYRALWLARGARFGPALDALDGARRRGARDAAQRLVELEVLARPLWAQTDGLAVPAAVLARLPAAGPAVAETTRLGGYWSALRAGDRAAQRVLLRRALEVDPGSPFTVLALARALPGAPAAERAATVTQLRAVARYQRMGRWMLHELRATVGSR